MAQIIGPGATGGVITHSPYHEERTSQTSAQLISQLHVRTLLLACCFNSQCFTKGMLHGLKRRPQKWCVNHGFARSTDGGAGSSGAHGGVLSTVSCPSLACRSERHFITHMFQWSRPRQRDGKERSCILVEYARIW